jgi:exonuclease III
MILLSDTRVISTKGVSASQRIENCLRDCKFRRYKAVFNSTGNSRGVAILIASDLSYVIHSEIRDALENFLIIDIEINTTRYGIGAIYGPNTTSRDFFHGLANGLITLKARGTNQFILGGDWNTTIDRNPVNNNIDTFCMAGLPNQKNSELLNVLCREFELLDPFRALFPIKRDYTYLPFGTARLNRSRIDFS